MKNILIVIMLLSVAIVAWSKDKVKVACVGNSITYGTGVTNREVNAYPFVLGRLLGEGYEVGNFGKPGATLLVKGHRPYVHQEEYRKALAFAADIVVIHLGVNDTDPRNWPNYGDEFISDYLALMDTFCMANPKARFIIARMTPLSHRHPRFLAGTRDWHSQIQHAIEEVAIQSGAQLIDFHSLLYPFPGLIPDGIHPDAKGAELMAKTVYSAITGDYGGLQMSLLYSDNMVIQRGVPIDIHGKADAAEQVIVSLDNTKMTTTAGNDGRWKVVLPARQADGKAHTLSISTKRRSLTYQNVALGEVWLCSGQSNMEFPLSQTTTGTTDIAMATDKDLRLYDMKAAYRTDNVEWPSTALDSINRLLHYRPTTWQTATASNAEAFSAVAYYFGHMLSDSLQVPIGLICNAVGGSTTESWIDRRTLEYRFPEILRDWRTNEIVMDWVRERAYKNLGKDAAKLQRHPYEPAYMFETGILPLDTFTIRGVLWYQGESNAQNIITHARLFGLLTDSWRSYWGNTELPIYFAQLSSIANRPSWPSFRNSQRLLTQSIPCVGMAITSDVGDPSDVHPRNKRPVGERLARLALHDTYNYHEVVSTGPLFSHAVFTERAAYVHFLYSVGLTTSDGEAPRTFEIAEHPGLYYPATAVIQADGTVRVSSPQVKSPRFVRYAWQPYTTANLINSAGLPASTFKSEQ